MIEEIRKSALWQTKAFIDGEFTNSSDTSFFPVYNPYTGEELAQVANATVADTRRAVEAAHKAFPLWRSKTAFERSAILRKWFDLITAQTESLGLLLTLEQGKPWSEAKGEITYGASFVEWFAEEAKRVYGDTIPSPQTDRRILVLKQPVGVVGAITPWNFPNAMITRKIAPALAAGCTVVLKPAQLTPLSALALAQLSLEAGFPKGVLNILPSDRASEIGRELTTNEKVQKISFTGSTEVGKILLEQSASTVKKMSLELGGNAPFIVFDDADLNSAVEGAVASKIRNAGQTCVCTNRIFVQEKIYDQFVTNLTIAVSKLSVGDGTKNETVIGPMIHKKALEFAEELVSDAVNKGASIRCGGKRLPDSKSELLYSPTVLSEATPDMRVFHEEIFAPIAPVYKFRDEDEVIHLSNNTPYGLASYFYGRDHARIWRVAEALDYGMVGVNTGLISTAVAPFGGMKQSGFGREGSRYGLDEYLEIKYVNWAL